MGDVRFTGTADYSQARRELEKLQKDLVKTKERLGDIAKESRKTNKEHLELARAAKKVYEETRTPQERYNRKLQELGRLLQAGKVDQETYGRAVRRAKEELDAAGKSGQKAFGAGALSDLAKMAAGYLTINSAIQLITASMRDKAEMERKSFEANRSFAEIQAGAIAMAGDLTAKQTEEFVAQVDALTARAKPIGGKQTAYQVLETTLSAAGEQGLAFRAAEVGMALGRKSPEEATALAGGLLDIAQVTGETEDMMKNAGFLIASTTQARVTTLKGMAEYGAVAAKAVQTRGGTAGESMAMFTALTKAMQDPEGRRAKTAAISLSEALAEYLPKEDLKEWKKIKGKEKEVTTRAGTGLGTSRERLEFLWANPEARRRFEAEYVDKMEKGAIGGVKALLAGPKAAAEQDAMVAKAYQQAIREIPPVEKAAPYAQRKIEAMGVPFAQKMAAGEQAIRSGIEQLATETEAGRKASVAGLYSKENLNQLMQMSGVDLVNRNMMLADWAFISGGHQQYFAKKVTRRIKELEHATGDLDVSIGPMGYPVYSRPKTEALPPTAEEKQQAAILRSMLSELQKQTTAIEAGNVNRPPPGATKAFSE